jgi:hypothetical protein
MCLQLRRADAHSCARTPKARDTACLFWTTDATINSNPLRFFSILGTPFHIPWNEGILQQMESAA